MKILKKLFMAILLIGMVFGTRSQRLTVNAEENSNIVGEDIEIVIPYINSQDPMGKDLINFAIATDANSEIEVLNDGGYKFGVAGKYSVTYGIKNTNIKKTFTIVVIESKGTLVNMEIIGGNTRIVDNVDTYGSILSVDTYVSNNIRARCLIKNLDGSYKVIETKLANSISGAGGGNGVFGATYTSELAMPAARNCGTRPESFTYYNPQDSHGNVIERNIWLIEKEYLSNTTLRDVNNILTINGNLFSYEKEYELGCDLNKSITKETIGTENFVAYNVYLTNGGFAEPVTPEQRYSAKITVPSNLNSSKVALYKINLDGSKTKVEASIKEGYIEFTTSNFPISLVIVEEENIQSPVITTPTVLEGDNSTWNLGDKQGVIIRSSASFESFVGVLVDGKMIHESNYNVKEGSIIMELSPSYLKTLKSGEHTITILSTEGNVEATVHVFTNNVGDSTVPKTSDASPIAISLYLFILSSSAMVVIYRKKIIDKY